ncbi:VCBS repeat-containing protein [Fodinibius sediminis]|uniref:Repeat domain-containing protein n=1 Tax=Fodinibius sediminis TaxID=1214077 RepID=A0A521CTQ2_9BACT|nr:VCBS repeat-containing protein [Fodinibius sediminis]SMO62867.1 Repeat domain-containing protein [Fodinibius sediminis]
MILIWKKRGQLFLHGLLLCLLLAIGFACQSNGERHTLFEPVASSESGVVFRNELTFSRELNPYTYRNFFNGGGVAVGDINNDGLVDIYFTGNQVSNRLYLNEGNFIFRDITEQAGVAVKGTWSTGASMVDVNGDGLLDLYVSKSGSPGGKNRHNELFINNGDLTFTEQSEVYGLNITGLATDALFFDYDRDGDLDAYVLNNSLDPLRNSAIKEGLRNQMDPQGGDQLLKNNSISTQPASAAGSTFENVTEQAHIYSSSIGFGLDVAVSDLNSDNWPDIYVTNDFFERDYLYLNNRDGTFSEVLPSVTGSISLSSMGADIADINNDARPDIFVTDMLPEDMSRRKSKTSFEKWDEYNKKVQEGYHHQFVRNTLQLNNGYSRNKTADFSGGNSPLPMVSFSEIGRMAGVEATDWSWSSLIADFNNDGHNDIYVTNGILHDLTDQDYVSDRMNISKLKQVVEKEAPVEVLFEELSSTPLANYLFAGTDSLQFSNKSKAWGLDTPTFSNGAAYADLDNDGDLDLIVNNINEEASLYRNNTNQKETSGNWLSLKLKGKKLNTSAVGAKVTVWSGEETYYREQMPGRGFQSSVDHRIHFGLGKNASVDSMLVVWPGGQYTVMKEVPLNQFLTVEETASGDENREPPPLPEPQFRNFTNRVSIDYIHRENPFRDFERNRLLYRSYASEGPPVCIVDLNGDGRDDLFLGGAKGQSGGVFIQEKDYRFRRISMPSLNEDSDAEDTSCAWFDANGDGQQDLYVGSGSSEFPASSTALADRLYINEGNMEWTKVASALPPSKYEVTSVVRAADFNSDGHIDLFTGSRLKPFAYGLPTDGHLLVNDGGGGFEEQTESLAPDLMKTGLITDASWSDYDNDGDLDLVVVGEWMPVRIFKNHADENAAVSFSEIKGPGGDSRGLWQSVEVVDLDGDGRKDIIAGNIGRNNAFELSTASPLELWINDFDENGSIDPLLAFSEEDEHYPYALRDDFLSRLPGMEPEVPSYKSYSRKSVQQLFDQEKIDESVRQQAVKAESVVLWNLGSDDFVMENLPEEVQQAPVYAIGATEDKEGRKELLLGGDLHDVKPEFGRYDAGYGGLVNVDSNRSLAFVTSLRSGIEFEGEVRAIRRLDTGRMPLFLILRNDGKPWWFVRKQD